MDLGRFSMLGSAFRATTYLGGNNDNNDES